MKALLVYLFFMVMLVIGYDGKEEDNVFKIRQKRSDGLVRDLLHQMVAERLERKKMLEEFQAIKSKVDDVGRELKVRNTLLQDTKFLQRKLLRDVKDMKEEVQEASKNVVKKALEKVNKKMTKMDNKGRMFSTKILKTVEEISKTVNGTKKRLSNVEYKCFIGNAVDCLRKKSDDHWKQIAFSAHLNQAPTTKSALVFVRVITNIGRGYNVSDGIFYCPKNGLYIFSVTLQGRHRVDVYGSLMKNNNSLAYMYEKDNGWGYPSVSISIAVKLVFGDRVWVKGRGIQYYTFSYFTGVYIGP